MPRKLPTTEQSLQCLRLCQWLSSLYQPIWLLRYDAETTEVYILAGKKEERPELLIRLFSDGSWRFENETELQDNE